MTTFRPVPSFTDTIAIRPHTVSMDALPHLDRRTTLAEFAKGEPLSLSKQLENGELTARTPSGRFITGPKA